MARHVVRGAGDLRTEDIGKQSLISSPLPFLPRLTREGLAHYLAAALFFYLPLSMPLHIAVHQLANHRSLFVSLAYPETWAILGLAVLAFGEARKERSQSDPGFRWIAGLAIAYLLLAGGAAIVQGSDPVFAVRKLAMQWFFPVVLALALRRLWTPGLDAVIQRSLVAGTFVLLLLALVTYWMSFGVPHSFYDLVVHNRTTVIWEGFKGGVYFGEVPFGGVNPLAGHIATISCLVMGGLISGAALLSRRFLLVWLVLAFLVEYLCFSRGVLLFLFAAAFALCAEAVRQKRTRHARPLALATTVLLIGAIAPPGALEYWKAQLGFHAGSTSASRWSQWGALGAGQEISRREIPSSAQEKMRRQAVETRQEEEPLSEDLRPVPPSAEYRRLKRQIEARIGSPSRRLVIGYGLGHYGILRGLVADSGSHNIFLDALLEAGILGALVFAALFLLSLVRRIRGWLRARRNAPGGLSELARLLALGSIAVIGVLVDYRFENLGTMTGAAVFWSLVVKPAENP